MNGARVLGRAGVDSVARMKGSPQVVIGEARWGGGD
jgi:hypothetical protein